MGTLRPLHRNPIESNAIDEFRISGWLAQLANGYMPAVQQDAYKCVMGMRVDSERNHIATSQDILRLIMVLRGEEIRVAGLRIVQMISYTEDNCRLLQEKGVVDLLFEFLTYHGDPSLQRESVTAINAFAKLDVRFADYIASSKDSLWAISRLVQKGDLHLQGKAIEALRSVAHHPEHRPSIANCGGMQATCDFVRNLALQISDQTTVAGKSLLYEMLESGSALAANLSCHSDVLKRDLLKTGILKELCRLLHRTGKMKSFASFEEPAMYQVTKALANIMIDEPSVRTTIPSLVSNLGHLIAPFQSDRVREAGMGALQNLVYRLGQAARLRVLDEIGLDPFLDGLDSSGISDEGQRNRIRQRAATVLRNLGRLRAEEKVRSMAEKVSGRLVSSLRNGTASVSRQVVCAICNFAYEDVSAARLVTEHDAVPPLMSLWPTLTSRDLNDLLSALGNLACDEESCVRIYHLVGTRVVDVLLGCATRVVEAPEETLKNVTGGMGIKMEADFASKRDDEAAVKITSNVNPEIEEENPDTGRSAMSLLRNLVLLSEYCCDGMIETPGFLTEVLARVAGGDETMQFLAVEIVHRYAMRDNDEIQMLLLSEDTLGSLLVPFNRTENRTSTLAATAFQKLKENENRIRYGNQDIWGRIYDTWQASDTGAVHRKATQRALWDPEDLAEAEGTVARRRRREYRGPKRRYREDRFTRRI